jgi:hypothetical protein
LLVEELSSSAVPLFVSEAGIFRAEAISRLEADFGVFQHNRPKADFADVSIIMKSAPQVFGPKIGDF